MLNLKFEPLTVINYTELIGEEDGSIPGKGNNRYPSLKPSPRTLYVPIIKSKLKGLQAGTRRRQSETSLRKWTGTCFCCSCRSR